MIATHLVILRLTRAETERLFSEEEDVDISIDYCSLLHEDF